MLRDRKSIKCKLRVEAVMHRVHVGLVVIACLAAAAEAAPQNKSADAGDGAADGSYPNYMIPVWKQRMFDRANNLTESGIQEFVQAAAAGHKYRCPCRTFCAASFALCFVHSYVAHLSTYIHTQLQTSSHAHTLIHIYVRACMHASIPIHAGWLHFKGVEL